MPIMLSNLPTSTEIMGLGRARRRTGEAKGVPYLPRDHGARIAAALDRHERRALKRACGRRRTLEGMRKGGIMAATLCLAMVALPGCASVQEFLRRPEMVQTARIAARRVAIGAGKAVLAAALSQLDRSKKADFLQGLSDGLWTQVPEVISPDAVEEIVRAWTPERSHWEATAKALAAEFARQNPRNREEALAILHSYADGIYAASVSGGGAR